MFLLLERPNMTFWLAVISETVVVAVFTTRDHHILDDLHKHNACSQVPPAASIEVGAF
jgi:hypothetical protein